MHCCVKLSVLAKAALIPECFSPVLCNSKLNIILDCPLYLGQETGNITVEFKHDDESYDKNDFSLGTCVEMCWTCKHEKDVLIPVLGVFLIPGTIWS